MDYMSIQFLLSVLQIIWIDILLSGDNAVVIALACRSLPARQRRTGVILGAGTAVLLRILFAFTITLLLAVPFLKLIGGALLLWIAVKLVKGKKAEDTLIAESDSLWKAVRTIAVADAVMSLDNVVAIAAASKGHPELFVFGLMVSIPLIVAGATLIMSLLTRFPALIWVGAGLLGWIAGEMVATDPVMIGWLGEATEGMHYLVATAGAAAVMTAGLVLTRRARSGRATAVPLLPTSHNLGLGRQGAFDDCRAGQGADGQPLRP
jgi:YjbE family integral membrane protein